MAFVQIMEYRTTKRDEMDALEQEWEKATEGKRTTRRLITGRDRNDPDRYFEIVFFDSYEAAMENSNLPETTEISARMAKLTDGLTFHDVEVIDDRAG